MQENKGIIHPCGTREEFNSNWYIASRFGEKRSNTWYHSGDDYNKKTGGNTDLNADLFAIADGEILTCRYKTTGFGNTLTMKFLLNGKVYYALYAHLNGFNCKSGDIVKKGERICRLGSSGNSTLAHLHFSIKNTANGIDNIPNDLEELKQWEDPYKFIEANYGNGSDSTDNSELKACLKQHGELVDKCNEKDKEIEGLIVERNNIGEAYKQLESNYNAEKLAHKATKKNHQGFVDTLADIFGSVHSDESVIKFASKNSNAFDDYLKFKDLYEREQQARKKDFEKHQEEVKGLQAQLEDLKAQNDRLASKLTNLSLQISNKLDEVGEAKEKIQKDENKPSKKSLLVQIIDFIKLLFK